MADALARESCVPCRKGALPLDRAETLTLLSQVPGWALAADGRSIHRHYGFPDFAQAFAFVARIAALADAADHHPDLGLGWGYVDVTLRTHAIDGLHRNDFIVAAGIDSWSLIV